MKEENEDGDEEDKPEEKPAMRSYGGYRPYDAYPYGRWRRAAEDDQAQKPAEKDPQCWQGIKDTIKDMKDEMDQQFPDKEEMELEECANFDVNQVKLDMIKMKKQCDSDMKENDDEDKVVNVRKRREVDEESASDKPECMSPESMPEDMEMPEGLSECIDAVKQFMQSMKDEAENMVDEVMDSMDKDDEDKDVEEEEGK